MENKKGKYFSIGIIGLAIVDITKLIYLIVSGSLKQEFLSEYSSADTSLYIISLIVAIVILSFISLSKVYVGLNGLKDNVNKYVRAFTMLELIVLGISVALSIVLIFKSLITIWEFILLVISFIIWFGFRSSVIKNKQ